MNPIERRFLFNPDSETDTYGAKVYYEQFRKITQDPSRYFARVNCWKVPQESVDTRMKGINAFWFIRPAIYLDRSSECLCFSPIQIPDLELYLMYLRSLAGKIHSFQELPYENGTPVKDEYLFEDREETYFKQELPLISFANLWSTNNSNITYIACPSILPKDDAITCVRESLNAGIKETVRWG